MRVRIRDQWYNSDNEPICIQVSEAERDLIATLDRSRTPNMKFAVFPAGWDDVDEKREFMAEEDCDINVIEPD